MIMQIIYLAPFKTLILDLLAWACFHLGLGFYSSRIPVEKIDPEKRFFQTLPWENGGRIYQQLFHIRSWKRFLPQGSKLYKDTFSLQKLESIDLVYLERWLRESIRAEICHWMMVIPGFLFFLWNSKTVGWFMVIYAAFNNFFPIVTQRFNRPRIRQLIEQAKRKTDTIEFPQEPGEKSLGLSGVYLLLPEPN
jgi:glycosyl-4,4'-diaponeurosporenoate acyltransferase